MYVSDRSSQQMCSFCHRSSDLTGIPINHSLTATVQRHFHVLLTYTTETWESDRIQSSAGSPSDAWRRNICLLDVKLHWEHCSFFENNVKQCDRSSHLTGSCWCLLPLCKCSPVCICVCPGVMGRRRQWQEIFTDSNNQKVLTDWLAGWLVDPPPLWVVHRLKGWPFCCLAKYIIGDWGASWLDGMDSYGLTDDVCRLSISLGTGCLDDVGGLGGLECPS